MQLILPLLFCLWLIEVRSQDVRADVTVQLSNGRVIHGAKPGSRALYAFTKTPAEETQPLALLDLGNGCKKMSSAGQDNFAVLVERGECNFSEKIKNAQNAGAKAVLVRDTVASYYNKTSGPGGYPQLKEEEGGACLVDCSMGQSRVVAPSQKAIFSGFKDSQCAMTATCASGLCGLSGLVQENGLHQICCLPDRYVNMRSGVKDEFNATIPAAFLGASDGLKLKEYIDTQPLEVQVGLRPVGFGHIFSAFLIWCMGMFAETLCTYVSASGDRRKRSERSGAVASQQRAPVKEVEHVDMTIGNALGYLLIACVGLVGLFFLIQAGPREVVFFLCFTFGMAAASAMSHLAILPALSKLLPDHNRSSYSLPCIGNFSLTQAISTLISLGLVVWWFVARHEPYAWLLQDIFGLFVCAQFFMVLKLNSIKVSTVLLVSFMLYDIFMVFISPAFFKTSVMVEVATAGKGQVKPSGAPGVCNRVPDEHMPMLFIIPRMGWIGGYAMLGLGDILLPGLLVAFTLRLDTLKQRAGSLCCCTKPYYTTAILGYGVGLFMAFLANTLGLTINGVQGQPALLYLVPCTLGPIALLALCRGELGLLWDGPPELVSNGYPSKISDETPAETTSPLVSV